MKMFEYLFLVDDSEIGVSISLFRRDVELGYKFERVERFYQLKKYPQ